MLDLRKQRLLVIAPHPDDEVIGCGALIKKIKDAGGKVYVLFLTVGDTADFSQKGKSKGNERIREIEKVAKFLKFDAWHLAFFGNKFHLQLDLLGQKKLMDVIERESPVALEKIKPTIVAFPSVSSYNQDHRVAASAAHAACRPAPKVHKHFVPFVISYEEVADEWSLTTNVDINTYIALTKTEIDAKMNALKLYKSQLRVTTNLRSPQSVKLLAMLRGRMIGSEFAEGYKAIRIT